MMPPPKKRKLGCRDSKRLVVNIAKAPTTFSSLDPLVLDHIFSFLDIGSLYRMAFSSKQMGKIVSHQQVVRASVLRGGHAKRTTEELHALISRRLIVVPSPLRWLRLVNGRSCELLDKCVHKVEGNTRKQVNFVRPGFGIFVCQECLSTSLVEPLKKTNLYGTMQAREVVRMPSSSISKKVIVLNEPFYDTTGERAGVMTTIKGGKESETSLINPYLYKMNEIQEAYQKASEDRYQMIQVSWLADRKKKELQITKRIKKLQWLIECLRMSLICLQVRSSMASTVPTWSTAWIEVLLDCEYLNLNLENCDNWHRLEPCATFRSPLIARHMKPYVVNPSRGSRKKMMKIALSIAHNMEMLWFSHFHDFSFLMDDPLVEPMETAFRHYFEAKCSIRDVLHSPALDDNFFDLIERRDMLNALRYFGRWSHLVSSHCGVFGGFDAAFAASMVKSADKDEQTTVDYRRLLAETLWGICANEELCGDFSSPQRSPGHMYKEIFDSASRKYDTLAPLIPGYLRFVQKEALDLFEGANDWESEVAHHVSTCCNFTWSCPRAIVSLEAYGYQNAYAEAWLAYQLSQWH